MQEITLQQLANIKERFLPDGPGPLIELHVLQTENGRSWVNRWPNPDVVLTETAGNYSLVGQPDAIKPNALRGLVKGFVATSPTFVPLLQTAFPDLIVWERLIFAQTVAAEINPPPSGFDVRRVTLADEVALLALGSEVSWVAKTWGGVMGMAASGTAWGAFGENGRLASLACTFFVGHQYEEIGITTEPAFRGVGLSTACSAAWCAAVAQRGRIGSWTTAPENMASQRVALKLGFRQHHRSFLYVIGINVPQ
ncbi:MAG: GNAT family N-acetyltransferase [Chloroflexota bacterium]